MKSTTTYKVEELNELREIRMQCQRSGFYSHWFLTEARGDTFTEVELGVDPVPGLGGRILDAIHTEGYLRRAAERSVDSLSAACAARRRGGESRIEP